LGTLEADNMLYNTPTAILKDLRMPTDQATPRVMRTQSNVFSRSFNLVRNLTNSF